MCRVLILRCPVATDKQCDGGFTVYPKKYAHGFVVLCFVVVMQSFIMNSHEVFIHIHQGCFAGTGAIVRLPQYQWSKPYGYGKISQCITTTKHSKAKPCAYFLGYTVNHNAIVKLTQGVLLLSMYILKKEVRFYHNLVLFAMKICFYKMYVLKHAKKVLKYYLIIDNDVPNMDISI